LFRKTGKCGVCGDPFLNGNHDYNKKHNDNVSGDHDGNPLLGNHDDKPLRGNHDINPRPGEQETLARTPLGNHVLYEKSGDHETGGKYAKGIIGRIYNKVRIKYM